uniref:Peptide methionine sulfoxide reductase MsrA n=1 Tax=candidate division WOR-3 bacterium TaxID=2052148 RepID=A0A7C4CB21_UNCW3
MDSAGLLLLATVLLTCAQPEPATGEETEVSTENATFAAGCFWGVEHHFRQLKGVINTTVGYTGGQTENPTYKEVCTNTTGHAEAVLVEFDPAVTTYERLLEEFWNIHDPTQLNRQGPDIGSQYRSAIFYHTPEQQTAALAAKKRLQESGRFPRPIVTEVVPAARFWPAEEYHQRYYEKHGVQGCNIRH